MHLTLFKQKCWSSVMKADIHYRDEEHEIADIMCVLKNTFIERHFGIYPTQNDRAKIQLQNLNI